MAPCWRKHAREAKLGDWADESVSLILGRGTPAVVDAEILIGRAVAQHVIGGDQDRGGHGVICFKNGERRRFAMAIALGSDFDAAFVRRTPGESENANQVRRLLPATGCDVRWVDAH